MLLEDGKARARSWEMAKRDLVVASTRNHLARLLKYYPKPPWAPILVKWRMIRPLPIYISYILNKYSLSLYVYARGILGCLLGFWPLGQNPAGAIKHAHIQVKNYAILDAMSSKAKSFFQVTRV